MIHIQCLAKQSLILFFMLLKKKLPNFILLKIFRSLFLHERHRERGAETQAEGEAGSLRGAPCGTRSQDPGVTPWAKGRHSTTDPSRCPENGHLALVPDPRERAFNISPLYMRLVMGWSYAAFVEIHSLYTYFVESFYMKG